MHTYSYLELLVSEFIQPVNPLKEMLERRSTLQNSKTNTRTMVKIIGGNDQFTQVERFAFRDITVRSDQGLTVH